MRCARTGVLVRDLEGYTGEVQVYRGEHLKFQKWLVGVSENTNTCPILAADCLGLSRVCTYIFLKIPAVLLK